MFLQLRTLKPFYLPFDGVHFDIVTLTLIGGVEHIDASGTKVRGDSHLLLVGDPGNFSYFMLAY